MAKRKPSPEDAKALATLALAKSILERDTVSARAALMAGADPEAFWIDGHTRLRELASKGWRWGTSGSDAMNALFTAESLKTLPPMKTDRARWSQSFVEFVAKRGYGFGGSTNPLSGKGGSEVRGLTTVKAGVRLISNKWRLIENATCADIDQKRASNWCLWFGPHWDGDRRRVGFCVDFRVDALVWELVEMFEEAKKTGTTHVKLDPADPVSIRQKDWEGSEITWKIVDDKFDLEDLIACLRKGGSPFLEISGELFGGPASGFRGTPEAEAFLDVLREAIGDREGWHLRIAPLLTDSGVSALREKASLKISVPKAKGLKKSLKIRNDIM